MTNKYFEFFRKTAAWKIWNLCDPDYLDGGPIKISIGLTLNKRWTIKWQLLMKNFCHNAHNSTQGARHKAEIRQGRRL